jgi:hypothetical protein
VLSKISLQLGLKEKETEEDEAILT